MHEGSSFLTLIQIFGSITAIVTIFHYLRIPSLIGFIGAGLAIGPHGLNLLSHFPNAEWITETAMILLMFTIGLEFSFQRFKEMRRTLFQLGFFQVTLTTLLVALVFHVGLDFSWQKALFLGMLFALSSTATIFKLLKDKRDFHSPHGKTAVGVLLFQDLAVIPMMMAVPFLADKTSEVSNPLGWKSLVLLFAALFIGKKLIPRVFEKIVGARSRELFFFSILFLCLGVAYFAHAIGLSLSLGAFIAGMLIAESAYSRQAMAELTLLRDNLLGIFFVSIGFMLDLPFIAENWHTVLLIALSFLLIKVGATYLVARSNRIPHSVAFLSSLILFQLGEFSFVLAQSGHQHGLLSNAELQFFLSLSVLTLIATPFVFKIAPIWANSNDFGEMTKKVLKKTIRRSDWVKEKKKPAEKGDSKESIIIGFGHAGQNLAKAFKNLEIPYKVIDFNYQSYKKFRSEPFIYGDATQASILRAAGLEKAKLVVLTVNGADMTKNILAAIRSLRPDIPVIVRLQYLLEFKNLNTSSKDDHVVAEFETSLEILSRALKAYGVRNQDLHQFMIESRERMSQRHPNFSDSFRQQVELPAWEALTAMQPICIDEDDFANGKTLSDLHLRQSTGVSIVAIYREGLGTKIPDSQFEFHGGDVAYALGEKGSIEEAENVLKNGTLS